MTTCCSPTNLTALLDLPDVPLDPSLRALLPSMEVVLADLVSPELARAVLRCARARADDAETVSETLLEFLQGATRADADALLVGWASRLRPPHDASVCWLALVAGAAAALPEPTKETFMTAAQQ